MCALELACRCRFGAAAKGCLHLGNLDAATGCCQSAVCAMKLGCWCRCRGSLRDVYGSVGVGPGPDRDYVDAVAKKASAWLPPKDIFCYLGSMLP